MSRTSNVGSALLGGLVGAVLGVAAMVVTRPDAPPPAAPPVSEERLAEALEVALTPLLDELRRTRRSARSDAESIVDPRSAQEPSSETADILTSEPLAGGTRGLPDAEPAEPLRPEGRDWTPEPRFEAVEPLAKLNTDMVVRQRWLFLGEHQALRRFGTPHEVFGSGVEERWTYHRMRTNEEGDEVKDTITLVFNRGRLIQVWD